MNSFDCGDRSFVTEGDRTGSGLCLELSPELSSCWASACSLPTPWKPFGRIQLCRAKDSGLNVERWGGAAYRQSLSQSLTIWRAWTNKNKSQYAVTSIRRAEKPNREKRSCVMQETRRDGCPYKKAKPLGGV